ncbi:MAG TPA: DUF4838 domain-containing protein [Phycisphaerae bacterium]|nr:DUF4838 domain-containing protein [Phycisphaerae bacterium]
MRRFIPLIAAFLGMVSAAAAPPGGVELVRDGRPVAKIVCTGAASGGKPGRNQADDSLAARTLVEWVRKITDAELPIVTAPPKEGPAVYVGAAAVQAGLDLSGIDSPTSEGLRVVCDGRRVLVAGQSPAATVKAACRLLEKLGCRYFMDHPLGEVFPRSTSLRVGPLDLRERPKLLMRSIWGSQWSGGGLWKVWNGAGGEPFATGHAWGQYVSPKVFDEHPEYFALRDGQRRRGQWYCTSNAELRKVFADGVIDRVRKGAKHPSISPPDGRGYCQCPACGAQDDPKVVEPSSGTVCVTNRYLDFFDAVGRRVAASCPGSVLSFYAYADYTQAPTLGRKVADNLCAWIAPIRYSRFHRIGSPSSPSRRQLAGLIDGWAKAVGRLGYRTYNYNLAECLVPFSKVSLWSHDIPYLAAKGCVGLNLETLANWEIYGPHIYLSIRLAYDPAADAGAIMDDYFAKFYGPAAAPMGEYWTRIDKAFAELKCESGSFYALHRVYTPEFLKELRGLVSKAAAAAREDEACAARVAMTAEGLRNAEQYAELRDAMNAGDFAKAAAVYRELLARSEAENAKGLGNHYTPGYLKRFVGGHVLAGAAATAPPNELLAVLPDVWRLAYDPQDAGAAGGYAKADFDDSSWREVRTFGDTLDAQGLPDRLTILWYRCAVDVPAGAKKPALFFTEVDGTATVYVNGVEVGLSGKKRRPFELDVTAAARPGRNVVAVRVDHSQLAELSLGGIVRPVLLIEKNQGR